MKTMKCLVQDCSNNAEFIRDILVIGEGVWYCTTHMSEDTRFIESYYPLTQERIEEELRAVESTKKALESLRRAWAEQRSKNKLI